MSTAKKAKDREDRQDILDLVNRYTDALHRRDWDVFGSLFTDDGVWEFPHFDTRLEGRTTIVETIKEQLIPVEYSWQSISSVAIELFGDTAQSRTWFSEYCMSPGRNTALDFFMLGAHYDDLVRASNAWKIKRRHVVLVYLDKTAPAGKFFPPPK